MTILQAITGVDDLYHNVFSQAQKVSWLSGLDATVAERVHDNLEGFDPGSFQGYTRDTPLDTQLLVAEPYDRMYLLWLEAKIAYYSHELERYNAAITLFNQAFADYACHCTWHHTPRGQKLRYF